MDASTLYGLAAIIGASSSFVAAVGTFLNGRAALVNREIGRQSVAASVANSAAIELVANQVSVVEVKVDATLEQTNGHMSALIDAVTPVDPVLASSIGGRIAQSAEHLAARLKNALEPPTDPK